jgi:hypothetical protein
MEIFDKNVNGLLRWFINLSESMGGNRTYDLVQGAVGTVNNMSLPSTSTSGISTSTRPYSYGEYRFDGINDYISVNPSIANLTAFSISVWFKSIATSQAYFYQERHTSTSGQFSFGLNEDFANDITAFNLDDSGSAWSVQRTDLSPNDGKWHHACAVQYSKSSAEMFFDGLSIGTSTLTIGTVTTNQAAIGARGDGTALFNGALDDVRLYKRALRLVEVQYLYNMSRLGYPIDVEKLAEGYYVPFIKPPFPYAL